MRNRLLEVSWGSVLFPQMLLSSSHASPLLSALFLMLLSGHVSAHLLSSCSQPKARSPEQGRIEVRVEEVDRQGEESEESGGAQIQHLACGGHQVAPFSSHPGHKICFSLLPIPLLYQKHS